MFFRFMSMKEFVKMSDGVTIKGHRFHARTTSEGVCFVEALGTKEAARQFDHLSGIVSEDVVVGFIPAKGVELTEAEGVYYCYDELAVFPEFCLPEYNRESMIPVCYSVDVAMPRNEWMWWDFN